MRYPAFLKENDTLGFVAPSFGCTIEPYLSTFKECVYQFEDKGYRTIIGENVYKDDGVGISTSPKECARELMEFYTSKENNFLLSVGGGELMCEILEYIDWDKIREAKEKWYMGYSDNTNFTFLLTTFCDVASIYGINATSFGMKPWHQSVTDAYEMMIGKKMSFKGYEYFQLESMKSEVNPYASYNDVVKNETTLYIGRNRFKNGEISFEGRIIGGCLDCLCKLCGTKYDKVRDYVKRYEHDGIIWFLEACDLNVFDMRRALWQLKEAGWFENATGFLIGRPMHYDESIMGLDRFDAVVNILEEFDLPIVTDIDVGHVPPTIPILCGSMAKVTVLGESYSICYEMM